MVRSAASATSCRSAHPDSIASLQGFHAAPSAMPCKSHPRGLVVVIDIWPDHQAVSPPRISRQAHVRILPNIDTPGSSSRQRGFALNRTLGKDIP